MKSTQSPSTPRAATLAPRGRHLVRGALLLVVLAISTACSLLVQRTTDQCTTRADCAPFGAYSECNAGVCVKPGSGSDGGACFSGLPTTDTEFFNRCTDGGCEPFDNCARLDLCKDAGLPPLISPDAGP